MKRLITLILILCSLSSIGQITWNSYPNKGTANINTVNASYFKLDGVPLDSTNGTRRGFFTPFQYNKLQSISTLYKLKSDSVNLSGFATNYKLNQKVSSQWVTSGSDIYYTTGNVGIGTSETSRALNVGGSSYFKMGNDDIFSIYDNQNSYLINFIEVSNLLYSIDPSNIGYSVGIGTSSPEYKLDVNGTARFGTGSNYTSTESDGTLVFTGDATVFDDIMGPFSTGQNGAAGYPPFVPDSSYYTFTLDTTSASICKIYFSIQLPHSYKEGSNIYPHIHYKQEGATTPVFKVKYKWVNAGGSIQTGWKWYTMATSTGTTDKTSQLLYNANGINGTGKTVSSIIYCQVYMSAVAAGRSTTNAYQFDIHFEKDAIGSRTTLSK